MMTLRDLFGVMWAITEVRITAREPEEKRYLHKWIYGPNVHESTHMYYDRMHGKLSIIDGKINAHGDPVRGGSETGWGVKTELFPKALIDAPIMHLGVINWKSGEYRVDADVEMPELTAMTLIPQEEKE